MMVKRLGKFPKGLFSEVITKKEARLREQERKKREILRREIIKATKQKKNQKTE